MLFLGSTIGNFTARSRRRFCTASGQRMQPGDSLLLGADLVKPRAKLLARLRRLAGRDRGVQSESAGAHQPRARTASSIWRSSRMRRGRTSGCSRDRDASAVARGAGGRDRGRLICAVSFARGETIWTESSHKFRVERFGGSASGRVAAGAAVGRSRLGFRRDAVLRAHVMSAVQFRHATFASAVGRFCSDLTFPLKRARRWCCWGAAGRARRPRCGWSTA